jgi:predicted ATPase/class 3 adenylate cyclase
MRSELRLTARAASGGGGDRLRMSVGVHSGEYHLFVVGGSHRELLIAGTATTEVTRMEKAAAPGEIVVSGATAAALPAACLGPARAQGCLLRSSPAPPDTPPEPQWWAPDEASIARSLSPELRAHVLAGPQPSEHRVVTVAFLRVEGTDALIASRGAERASEVLDELTTAIGAAADERQVCFLGSDIDANGVKFILTAGAPRAVGDEEERMLLVLRRIVDDGLPLPVRIGVHRGPLFAGDIGPAYRRTYTVMGDVVNLAARLMAKAQDGEIYATSAVVDRSPTHFATTGLEPFMVKGKARPIHALAIGSVLGRRGAGDSVPVRFPLIGREPELALLQQALDDASRGQGRLVELVSEPGMGRARLMEELRDRDEDFRVLHAACEPHTTATPYRAWRGLVREMAGVAGDFADEVVLERLRHTLEADDPAMLPWLPLLAIVLDIEAPSTTEVDQLAPEFRGPKLQEVVLRFICRQVPAWALIELADAHLMDEASAELLHALERQLPVLPWLVVVTRRDSESGFVAEAGPHLVRLDLGPLEPEQALALARAVTETSPLPPHLVRLAAERSGGSPQFLRDLLRAAADGSSELPESIEAAAMARIDRLRPDDRALVRRASVLGTGFHPRQLDNLLGDSVPAPNAATWDRLAAYFAEEGDGRLRFRRQVVRDVAYAGLPFRVRRELHAEAGTRLERELGLDADDEAAGLCVHFLLAGRYAKAWRYARLAAERALQQFAFADAAQLHRRALEAAGHFDAPADEVIAVWEALGEALARIGELREADVAFRSARRRVGPDRVHEAALLLRHAQVAERAGRVVPAIRWAQRGLRALDGLESGAARSCRARTLSLLATVRQRQGRMEQAISLCRAAIAEAMAAGEDSALAHACFILDWALFDSGRSDEATHSHRSLAIYERLGELDRQAAVLNNLGGFAYHEGRWDDATELYRRAAEASERAGDVANAAFGDCNVGEVLSDQGRWAEAELKLREALRIWRGSGYEWGTAFATALLGRTAVRAGRDAEGLDLLASALAAFRRLGARGDLALVEAYQAEALAYRGESERALSTADRLLRDAGRTAALLHRVRGFALAARGADGPAALAFEASLAAARAHAIDFEIAMTLEALERLPSTLDEDRAERHEWRDALLARLDVVAVAAPPLPSSPAPARAGAGAD